MTGRLVSMCGQIGVIASAATRRKHDGAAGGERIRGGSGGRRDDQSVGFVDAHEVIVDLDFQVDHARDLGLGQHHVVQRVVFGQKTLARATARSAACGGARRESRQSMRVRAADKFHRRDRRQKSEAAEIHGEQRNIAAPQRRERRRAACRRRRARSRVACLSAPLRGTKRRRGPHRLRLSASSRAVTPRSASHVDQFRHDARRVIAARLGDNADGV